MATHRFRKCHALAVLGVFAILSAVGQAADLRQAAPPDAYVAVHGRRNPERAFQRAHYERVWNKLEEVRLFDRLIEIVSARVSAEDRQRADAVWKELEQAVAPADWQALTDCQEVLYAQTMRFPFQQQVVCLRTTAEATAGYQQAARNLMGLAEKYSEGHVTVRSTPLGDVEMFSLNMPGEVPMAPACAAMEDVFVVGSSPEMVRQTVERLTGAGGPSKFDDPRFQDALARLPAAEDSVAIFDGRQYFEEWRRLPEFIRREAHGDGEAEKAIQLIDDVLQEVAILDYVVTVEYTEENRNCAASYGRLLPGAEDKVLYEILGRAQPFGDWRSWIPAEATGFSLSSGVNCHPLYAWVAEKLPEISPEARAAFEKWEALQQQYGVHLDRDILQSFSGETVSISLPAAAPGAFGGQDSVTFLRCQKEDRIRELLHRGIETLHDIPALAAQQIKLVPVDELDGFEELSCTILAAFGVRPVIGFRDGWMIIGSNPQCVDTVLKTRSMEHPSFAETDAFDRFHLAVDGPVNAISFRNLAEQTRATAQALRQVGAIVPTVIAITGARADDEGMKLASELLALLPSVADVVEQFDFLESQLSVTQAAPEPGAWTTRAVTIVRPATDEASHE